MVIQLMLAGSSLKNSVQCRWFASLREMALAKGPRHIYEPLFDEKKRCPDYGMVHIRLQGYDYVPLEKYQSYVHKIAKRFEFNVKERFVLVCYFYAVRSISLF